MNSTVQLFNLFDLHLLLLNTFFLKERGISFLWRPAVPVTLSDKSIEGISGFIFETLYVTACHFFSIYIFIHSVLLDEFLYIELTCFLRFSPVIFFVSILK